MAKKLYDLAVKTGSYTDRDGNEKGRYQNVGSVMQSDDGNKFIMLSRVFNPAGVPAKEGSDSILVSMFKPKENEGGGGQRAAAPAPARAPKPQQSDDSDIPF